MTNRVGAEQVLSSDVLHLSGTPNPTVWHSSAPKRVRRADTANGTSEAWQAWQEYLAGRKSVRALSELLPGQENPLLWAIADAEVRDRLVALIGTIAQPANGKPRDSAAIEAAATAWLAKKMGLGDTGFALEALVWCHALPSLARNLQAETWWNLLDRLLKTAAEAESLALKESPLVHQLLAGELALTLGYQFLELMPCRQAAASARKALVAGLGELLDGEGLPHAKHLDQMRPLLACWTRCQAMGNEMPGGCWNSSARTQYEWLIRQALRFTRNDGTQALGDEATLPSIEGLLESALRLGGDDEDQYLADQVLPWRKKTSGRATPRRIPPASLHSEWAAAAMLRAGWGKSDPWLAVASPGTRVRTELQCDREALWSGDWELEIRRDGKPAEVLTTWEEVCWVSDEEVDYLELEAELSEGLRVQRHLLLAKQERLLFLADAILGTSPAALEYRGMLPLRAGIEFQIATETREGFLTTADGKQRALVMPLALPEWQIDPRVGSLRQTEGGLELRQKAQGTCLFAPLWFDLKSSRMTKPRTWRQLTVAENLTIQPPDVAVGYRVMSDNQQWLIYRALLTKGNRTLLGHNLTTGMLVARFRRDGEVESLVEIE